MQSCHALEDCKDVLVILMHLEILEMLVKLGSSHLQILLKLLKYTYTSLSRVVCQ